MKRLLDLRPCDQCGGPIAPMFYLLRVSMAMVNKRAVDEFMGMDRFFGGQSPVLAEMFAPAAANGVTVMGDEDKSLMTELVICNTCYLDRPLDLALLLEKRRATDEAKATK